MVMALPDSKMVCRARFIQHQLGRYNLRLSDDHLPFRHYRSPVFQYKTELITYLCRNSARSEAAPSDDHVIMNGSSRPSIVSMDITTLVLSAECWWEMIHQKEDLVSSAEDLGGLPRWFGKKHGMALNSGLQLVRPRALPLMEEWERQHLRVGGTQQMQLAKVLDGHGFLWTDAKEDGKFRTGSAVTNWEGVGPITIHALGPISTNGDNGGRWHRAKSCDAMRDVRRCEATRCLFHPFVENHTDHEDVFRKAGLWYS